MKASMVGDIRASPTAPTGADFGQLQMDLRGAQPVRRLHCGPLQQALGDRWQSVRVVGRHVVDGARFDVSRTPGGRGRLWGSARRSTFPAALALISRRIPHSARTRSRAVGMHQAGIYVRADPSAGLPATVADSPDHGWRWAFSSLRHGRRDCSRIPLIAVTSAIRCGLRPRCRRRAAPSLADRALQSADCWATAISFCSWSSISRCRPSPAGSCSDWMPTSSREKVLPSARATPG